jgi:hypothetical protein
VELPLGSCLGQPGGLFYPRVGNSLQSSLLTPCPARIVPISSLERCVLKIGRYSSPPSALPVPGTPGAELLCLVTERSPHGRTYYAAPLEQRSETWLSV